MKLMFSWIAFGLFVIGAATGVATLIVGALAQDEFLITVGVVLLVVSAVSLAMSIVVALREPHSSQNSETARS